MMMLWKISLNIIISCLLFYSPTIIYASDSGDDDASDSGDDDFYNFNEEGVVWSDYSIYPKKCVNINNEDAIVFEMFGKNHKSCSKKSLGTYRATLYDFVKAYTRQAEDDADANGQGFEASEDAMDLLECQGNYYDDNGGYVYHKIVCGNTGKAFKVATFSDEYCTVLSNQQKNMNIDLSTLRISYDTCKSCVQQQNNDDQGYYNTYYTNQNSRLCSATWNYKAECNGKCKKLARNSSKSTRTFSATGKFFLFVFSILGFFLLLAVLAQRKKMSTEDALIEEAAVKKVGLEMKYLPRIALGLIFVIAFLMLLHIRTLTWIFLILTDIMLLGYWCYLKNRAEGQISIGGFQLYSDAEHSLN